MSRKRSAPSTEYVVSDEAAAYIADALMEIALQFEETHFAPVAQPLWEMTGSLLAMEIRTGEG